MVAPDEKHIRTWQGAVVGTGLTRLSLATAYGKGRQRPFIFGETILNFGTGT